MAIFSTEYEAEQWVRGSGKGTCFSFFPYRPLGTVSTPVTRQIRHRGRRPETREGLEGWEAMKGDRGELRGGSALVEADSPEEEERRGAQSQLRAGCTLLGLSFHEPGAELSLQMVPLPPSL